MPQRRFRHATRAGPSTRHVSESTSAARGRERFRCRHTSRAARSPRAPSNSLVAALVRMPRALQANAPAWKGRAESRSLRLVPTPQPRTLGNERSAMIPSDFPNARCVTVTARIAFAIPAQAREANRWLRPPSARMAQGLPHSRSPGSGDTEASFFWPAP